MFSSIVSAYNVVALSCVVARVSGRGKLFSVEKKNNKIISPESSIFIAQPAISLLFTASRRNAWNITDIREVSTQVSSAHVECCANSINR